MNSTTNESKKRRTRKQPSIPKYIQPDLFGTIAETRRVTKAAIELSASGDSKEWRETIDPIIRFVCRTHVDLTTDDIWLAYGHFITRTGRKIREGDRRRMGPALLRAAKAGWCHLKIPKETRPSLRVKAHRGVKQVWTSDIYGQVDEQREAAD